MIEVKLYGPFREDVGEKVVRVPTDGDRTVGAVLQHLVEAHPVLEEKLYEDGRLRRAINVMRNGRNVKLLDGEATPVEDGDRLSVMVSIEGGSAPRGGGSWDVPLAGSDRSAWTRSAAPLE